LDVVHSRCFEDTTVNFLKLMKRLNDFKGKGEEPNSKPLHLENVWYLMEDISFL
jgi:hypothetical protein